MSSSLTQTVNLICAGGETGKRTGLKILRPGTVLRVRPPPGALTSLLLSPIDGRLEFSGKLEKNRLKLATLVY